LTPLWGEQQFKHGAFFTPVWLETAKAVVVRHGTDSQASNSMDEPVETQHSSASSHWTFP
jgi:hypothetical protein